MQVKDYLNDLLGKIEACPYIESQNIACEEYPPDAVYINGQVIFTNWFKTDLQRVYSIWNWKGKDIEICL